MWSSSKKITITESSYHSSTKFESSSYPLSRSHRGKITNMEETVRKEAKSENRRNGNLPKKEDKKNMNESNLRRNVKEKLAKGKFRENCISSEAIALPWVPAESNPSTEERKKHSMNDDSNKKVVVELKWLDNENSGSRNGSVEPAPCAIKASLTLSEVDKVSEFITQLKMEKTGNAQNSTDSSSPGTRATSSTPGEALLCPQNNSYQDPYDSDSLASRRNDCCNVNAKGLKGNKLSDLYSPKQDDDLMYGTKTLSKVSARCATPLHEDSLPGTNDLLGSRALRSYSTQRSIHENDDPVRDTTPLRMTRGATPYDAMTRSTLHGNGPYNSNIPSGVASDPLLDTYSRSSRASSAIPSESQRGPIATYDTLELDHMVQSALALARARRGLSLQRILDEPSNIPQRRPMSRLRDTMSMSRTDDRDSYSSRYSNYTKYERASCEPFNFTSTVPSMKEENPSSYVTDNTPAARLSMRATSMPAASRNMRDVRTMEKEMVSDSVSSLNATNGTDTVALEEIPHCNGTQMIRGSSPSSRKPSILPEIIEEQDKDANIVEEMDLLTTYHGAGVLSSLLIDDIPEIKVPVKDPRRGRSVSVMRKMLSDGEGRYSRETTPMSNIRKQFKEKMKIVNLHEATLLGDLRAIQSLLDETEVDVNSTDDMGRTALHMAAEKGHKDLVTMLIENGCKVNVSDVDGRSPLHYAVESGEVDTVSPLLEAGAEVDVVEKRRGRTPIHLAVVGNNLDILLVLLQPLIDDPLLGERVLKLTDKTGKTLLHMAAHHGLLEAASLLINAGADVNIKDISGHTPMHAVILTRLRKKDRICSKVLEVLLDSGGDTEGGTEGEGVSEAGTLVHAAASTGCEDCLRVLVKRSAKLETKNFFGKTPLQIAIEENHIDAVAFLLDNNASIEEMDSKGQRPLHYAIMSDSPRLVEMILQNGAEHDAKDKDGNTYCLFALIKRRYQALDTLVRKKVTDVGEDQQAIHYCSSAGDQTGIDVLLNNAININAADSKGRTALHLAISDGHENLVNYLLANGCSARRADDNGATPLHYAVRWGGSDALLRRLLKKQGNVNEVDRLGRTPLHYAASKSSIMSDMYILINNGAQINVRDDRGLTPLHLAARLGNESLVRILLDNDARHDIPDCDDFLPIDHAKENAHKCIIKRLEAYHIKKVREKETRLNSYVAKKEDLEAVEVKDLVQEES